MSDDVQRLVTLVEVQADRLRAGDIDAYLASEALLAEGWRAVEHSANASSGLESLLDLRAACEELNLEATAQMHQIATRLASLGRARAATSAYFATQPASARRLHTA